MINTTAPKPTPRRPFAQRPLSRVLGLLALCSLALAAGAIEGARASLAAPSGPPARLSVSATLEQCLTAATQAERSATFAGEMAAIPGTARMEMRVDVIERMSGEDLYHTVSAPGLGVWRESAPGVKAYRYLKQVTNLTGGAFYRGAVSFRWLNAKGRLLAVTELRTKRCEQPVASTPTPVPVTPPASVPSG